MTAQAYAACPTCGGPVEPNERGRPRIYCDAECLRLAKNAATAAHRAATRAPTIPRTCEGCGIVFTPTRSDQRYHDRNCRQRHCKRPAKNHRRPRNCSHCGDEFIPRVKVAERDGWRCHICKRKVAAVDGHGSETNKTEGDEEVSSMRLPRRLTAAEGAGPPPGARAARGPRRPAVDVGGLHGRRGVRGVRRPRPALAGRGGVLMPDGPVKASQVAPSTKKSADELRRERVTNAVRQRQAKREALRLAGADVAPSSDDLAARIEHGLKKRDDAVQADYRAKAAVRKSQVALAVKQKLGEKGGA